MRTQTDSYWDTEEEPGPNYQDHGTLSNTTKEHCLYDLLYLWEKKMLSTDCAIVDFYKNSLNIVSCEVVCPSHTDLVKYGSAHLFCDRIMCTVVTLTNKSRQYLVFPTETTEFSWKFRKKKKRLFHQWETLYIALVVILRT